MKKFKMKSLVMLICAALLLTCTVSGTVAYLVDGSESVTNTFTPTKVEVTVTDKIEGGAKKDVVINNKSDIPVYIRVAVVAYWKNEAGEIVAPWNDYAGLPVAAGWSRALDGFYYYGPTSAQEILFFTQGSSYSTTAPVEGAHLEMDILVQAVQADGMGATSAQDAFTKAAVVSTTN